MGARGPAPKPREMQIESGSVRSDKLPEPVNVGTKLTAAPPAPVGMPAEIALVWDELAPLLARSGMLAESDLYLLDGLCTFLARARAAREAMENQPLTVIGAKGGEIANPLLRIERDAWAQAHRLAVEFGMSPSARARLGISLLTGRSLQHELQQRLAAEDETQAPLTIEVND